MARGEGGGGGGRARGPGGRRCCNGKVYLTYETLLRVISPAFLPMLLPHGFQACSSTTQQATDSAAADSSSNPVVAEGLDAIEIVGDGAGAGADTIGGGGSRAGAGEGTGAGAETDVGAGAGSGGSALLTLYLACSGLESSLHSWPKVRSLAELRRPAGRTGRCSWQKTK